MSTLNEEERFPPLEEHAGFIDASAGIDVAHAILAFEFIDRINDEVLNHYLPLIDDELGKPLNLRHERGRLRTPVENADASDASVRSSPVVEGSEGEGDGSQSTAYYDQGERVSGSGYEAASNGESAGGDPVGEEDLQRSRPDSRQESWGSASHAEELTPDGSEGAADAWSGEGSAGAPPQSGSSRSRDSRSEGAIEDEYMDEDELAEIGEDEEGEEESSSRADAYRDAPGDAGSSGSGGQSFGSSSDYGPDIMPTANSAAQDSDMVQVRSDSQQSESPDFFDDKAPGGTLQSGGPSSVSHGFGSRAGYWGGSNSAESQVWPHACSILPKAASQARSSKLKAVDSIPDPVAQNMFDISTSSAGGPASLQRGSMTSSTVGKVTHPGSTSGGAFNARVRRSTILAGVPLDVLLPDVNAPIKPNVANALPLSDLNLAADPGVAAAGVSAVYGPGACRVRRPGDKDKLARAHAKLQKRAEKRAQDSARAAQRSSRGGVGSRVTRSSGSPVTSATKSDSNVVEGGANSLAASAPTANVPSGGPNTPPSSSRDAAGGGSHRSTAASAADARGGLSDNMPGGGSPVGASGQTTNTVSTGRHMPGIGHANATGCLPVAEEEQTWPPRRPSPTGDQFEDLLTMHLRGDSNQPVKQSSPSDRRQRRANSTCPFSHGVSECCRPQMRASLRSCPIGRRPACGTRVLLRWVCN